MNRRLKNRMPLAVKGKKFGAQLAIVIVTNIWIAPHVIAQVRGTTPEVTLVKEAQKGPNPNIYTKTYTKEELSQVAPANPTADLGSVIQSQVTSLLRSMTDQQTNGKLLEIYNGAAAKNKSDFALFAAAMRDDRIDRGSDGDQLRNYMSNSFQGTASDKAIKSNSLLAKIKTGVNFNLDLGNIFSKRAKPQQGSVRYGLIIQGINPDASAPSQAAIGDMEDQMAYAGRAEVLWTIGPIAEESKKPFSDVIVSNNEASEKKSFWSKWRAPSGKFNGKLDPAQTDGSAPAPGGIPGVRFTATQEEGFYELMYQTRTNFVKDKMEHQFKAPVAGELAFGRRYNDNFQVIQTSAFNILVDKRAPAVNIHYLNLEERYSAELHVTKNRHEIGANVDLPTGWKPDDKLGKNPGENYRAEYKFSF